MSIVVSLISRQPPLFLRSTSCSFFIYFPWAHSTVIHTVTTFEWTLSARHGRPGRGWWGLGPSSIQEISHFFRFLLPRCLWSHLRTFIFLIQCYSLSFISSVLLGNLVPIDIRVARQDSMPMWERCSDIPIGLNNIREYHYISSILSVRFYI